MIKLANILDKLITESTQIKYKEPNFQHEWQEAIRYPEFKKIGKEKWMKIARQGYIENFSKIKKVLGNVDLNYQDLDIKKRTRFEKAFKSQIIEYPIVVKFNDQDYDLLGGNTRVAGLINQGIDPKVWIVDLSLFM